MLSIGKPPIQSRFIKGKDELSLDKICLKTYINKHGLSIQTHDLVVIGSNPLLATIYILINHFNNNGSIRAYQFLFTLQARYDPLGSASHFCQAP